MTEIPICEAVIFDMDGVIFDTEKMVQEAWQVVADRYGIPDIKYACTECLGLNQPATKVRFRQIYGEDFPYDKYKAEMREVFYSKEFYGDSLPLKKGVVEILEYLRNKGTPISLATSTRKEAVYRELEEAGLKEYFDVIICGDMVSKSKPDPEIFLRACRELGVAPEKVIVVEDSYNGVIAAYDGKMMPIMVPDLVQPTDEIIKMTYRVFDTLDVLREFLDK